LHGMWEFTRAMEWSTTLETPPRASSTGPCSAGYQDTEGLTNDQGSEGRTNRAYRRNRLQRRGTRMTEVSYNDIRTGQWIKVVHEYRENGPTQPYTREWVGKVSEVSQKWLKLTHKK